MREDKCDGQDKMTFEQILERFEGVTYVIIRKKYVPDRRTSKHVPPMSVCVCHVLESARRLEKSEQVGNNR